MADSVNTTPKENDQSPSTVLGLINDVDGAIINLNGLRTSMACVLTMMQEEEPKLYEHELFEAVRCLYFNMIDQIDVVEKTRNRLPN